MSTSYRASLPAVPVDRWNASSGGNGGDPDAGTAWADLTLDAPDATTAEQRALAYIDHDYEDDLRGAVATTQPADPDNPGRFTVRVVFARSR